MDQNLSVRVKKRGPRNGKVKSRNGAFRTGKKFKVEKPKMAKRARKYRQGRAGPKKVSKHGV